MRQFYDEPRTFRVTNEIPGQYQFVAMNNGLIGPQPTGVLPTGEETYRVPVFDLKIKAQRRNPFSRMEENERAKELYALGFFDPYRAQESLIALEMMDFEGKDKIVEKIRQGQTLLNMVQQLTEIIGSLTGMGAMGEPAAAEGGGGAPQQSAPQQQGTPRSGGQTGDIMESRTPMQPYAQRLAKRSRPNMDEGV